MGTKLNLIPCCHSASSLPSFDVARYIETETGTRQEVHCKKTNNHVCTTCCTTAVPPSQRGDQTLSCLPGAPALVLQEKKKHKTNHDKHDRKRTARKQNNHVPPPSLRLDKLSHVCLARPLSLCIELFRVCSSTCTLRVCCVAFVRVCVCQ